MRLDSGVKGYRYGTANIKIGFPVDWRDNEYVRCTNCKLYLYGSGRCCLTNEIIPFPDRAIGYECPLEFKEDENE